MNSPFANIFLAISQRIQSEVPEIRFIEQDLGQLEGYSTRPEIALPCTIIDFDAWSFAGLSDNAQTAEGDVVIKLALAPNSTSSNLTPLQWRELALNYYDVEWKLHKALQGWSPADEVGHLIRTNVITQNLPLGIRLRTIRYRLAFEDGSTQSNWSLTPTPPISFSN